MFRGLTGVIVLLALAVNTVAASGRTHTYCVASCAPPAAVNVQAAASTQLVL